MLTCVRWYVAYPLSLRHIEEIRADDFHDKYAGLNDNWFDGFGVARVEDEFTRLNGSSVVRNFAFCNYSETTIAASKNCQPWVNQTEG
jgi:hypothetical protein